MTVEGGALGGEVWWNKALASEYQQVWGVP